MLRILLTKTPKGMGRKMLQFYNEKALSSYIGKAEEGGTKVVGIYRAIGVKVLIDGGERICFTQQELELRLKAGCVIIETMNEEETFNAWLSSSYK